MSGGRAEGPGEGAVDADAAALRVGRDADADWQHVQERLLLEHVPGELTIGFCQPLLPLFSAGLGLLQRQFRAFAIRDIDADSVERARPSVVVVDGASASLHPSPFAAAGLEPELDDVIGSVRDGLVDHSPHGGTIFRVDEVEEPCLRAVEPARLQAEDLLELAAPPDFVGREVARPRTHGAAAHRQRQHVAALAQIVGTVAQRRFETLAVGHRRAQEQTGRREHAHEYLELDQAVVEILAGERAAALARMPDRYCPTRSERRARSPATRRSRPHQSPAGRLVYSMGCAPRPSNCPNTSCARRTEPATNRAVLSVSCRDHSCRATARIAGATMTAPRASPSHQSNQSSRNCAHC